jgi:hypothetical protein
VAASAVARRVLESRRAIVIGFSRSFKWLETILETGTPNPK